MKTVQTEDATIALDLQIFRHLENRTSQTTKRFSMGKSQQRAVRGMSRVYWESLKEDRGEVFKGLGFGVLVLGCLSYAPIWKLLS